MELISHMRSGHDIMHIPPNDSFLCHSCPHFQNIRSKNNPKQYVWCELRKELIPGHLVASVKPTEVVRSTSGACHACLQPIFHEIAERMPQFCKQLHTYKTHLIQLCVSYYRVKAPGSSFSSENCDSQICKQTWFLCILKKTMKQQDEVLKTWHQT